MTIPRRGLLVPLFLSMLCAFPASAEIGNDWQWINPLPASVTIADFCDVGDGRVFAVGTAGICLRSDDGGATWTLLDTGTGAWLLGVDFTDRLHGTIVGESEIEGVILRTVDGGETWIRQDDPGMPWLETVDFIDADTGVICGWSGAVYWTWDGGDHWHLRDPGIGDRLYSISLLDAETAVVCGLNGVICRTVDAGLNWTFPASNVTGRLESVAFGDSLRGVIAGQGGRILRTSNGGVSWTIRVSGSGSWFQDVVADGSGLFVAAGLYEPPVYSTDWGYNWSAVDLPMDENWYAASLVPGGGLLLGSGGSLWLSDPAWTDWQNGVSGPTGILHSISRLSDEIAVAVGSGGLILRTTDEGLTWTEIESGVATDLLGVDFLDADNGLACGADGVVIATADGGLTWTPWPTGTSLYLRDIAHPGPGHAVAVGQDRSILVTWDGGQTWQDVGSPSAYDYHQAVFFLDGTSGWTCTFYGQIYHTADGGATWSVQHSSYLDLQDITFGDALHGISVGGVDGNATLLTDDGGLTWTEQSNPEYSYLYGVAFADALEGIAVGPEGIFRTGDGAATWEKDYAWGAFLLDVCLLNEDVVLTVGSGGVILRAGPDGPSAVVRLPRAAGIPVAISPNPFNPVTAVAFDLDRAQQAAVRIYDPAGRLVRTLAEGFFAAGRNDLPWDGRDDFGRILAAGVYLVRVEGEMTRGVGKAVLVK